MILFPGTKINLGLHITEKRPDGYHNIETVFYPLKYGDAVEGIVSSESTRYTTSGLPINVRKEDDLVWRAYEEMSKYYVLPQFHFHLHKVVPPGTGLGGGSADAAAIILMINELAKLQLSEDQLLQHASVLGADCAFFILRKPIMAQGRGDQFSAIDVDLSPFHVVIALPQEKINTAWAYAQATPKMPLTSLQEIISKPIDSWKSYLKNDFEEISDLPNCVMEIKECMYHHGALYAAMSGSGSAVYGIFDHEPNALKIDDCEIIYC